MKHPHSRSERRAVRDNYIAYRKHIKTKIWTCFHNEDNPHEGEGYHYDNYIKYLNWVALSDEEKKLIEVEALLDNQEFEPPYWFIEQWGRYAKYNLTCSCHNCDDRYDRKHQGRNEFKRKAINDSIIDYDPPIA